MYANAAPHASKNVKLNSYSAALKAGVAKKAMLSARNTFLNNPMMKVVIPAAKFSNFKVYDWREHTRIERSSFTDETLLMQMWDTAENAVSEFNAAYEKLDRIKYDTRMAVLPEIREILKVHGFSNNDLNNTIEEELKRDAIFQDPVLIRSVNKNNIVSFAGLFYCLPQALGPIDFHKQNVQAMSGVYIADNLSELMNTVGSNVV